MIKQLIIQTRIEGDKIQTVSKREGFEDGASGIIEVIGILENLKQIELDKLKKHANVKFPLDKDDQGYHIL